MGGNELAEIFSVKYPDTKIIFTSGYSDHSVVQKWIDQGCYFIQKPYTAAELLWTIQKALKKSEVDGAK
jgi:FixJ family two-component response regulator